MSTEPKTPVVEEQTLPLRTPREASVGEVAAEQPHGPRRILVLGATSGIAEACIRLWRTAAMRFTWWRGMRTSWP